MASYNQAPPETPPAGDMIRPTLDDVRRDTSRMLQNYMAARAQERLPEPFPPTLADGVGWWLNCLTEPEKPFERPSLVNSQRGDFWIYPYRDRNRYLLTRFLGLDGAERRTIAAAREEGIHWRGDDPQFLRQVYVEHAKMAEMGAEKYIPEAFRQMRQMIAKMEKRTAKMKA